MDSLPSDSATAHDKWIATHHSKIIVIAIIFTSTLGSVLTTALGPILLSRDTKVAPMGEFLVYLKLTHTFVLV